MSAATALVQSSEPFRASIDAENDWLGELAVPDFAWVVNTGMKYSSLLKSVPDIFAWQESGPKLETAHVLARSVALHRLRSCLDHIGRYDRALSDAMRVSFEALPVSGKLRFMTAPETFYRISQLRKHPQESITFLCNALNAEAALHGFAPIGKDDLSALGDFYWSDLELGLDTATDGGGTSASVPALRAPLLAGVIPIDFASPNALTARETEAPIQYVPYSMEDKALVCKKLNEAFERIVAQNEPAARLIREFVRVIIPLKTADRSQGSTSQSHVPGRVLIRGVEQSGIGALASNLVHEATHQFLYILEWCGSFVIRHPDVEVVRVKSGWTGRDLPLHSYVHACVVWYGLSNFWMGERSFSVFEPADIEHELARSISGFRDRNPVDSLEPYAGMVRYDFLRVAATLRERLLFAIQESKHGST